MAAQFKTAVHYEELKAAINERRKQNRERLRFLFPFAGESFKEGIKDWYLKKKEEVHSAIERKKKDK